MSATRLVLWPDDAFGSGYVYGWHSPLIVVAGILRSTDLDDAQAELHCTKRSQDWSSLSGLYGSYPTILGRVLGITEDVANVQSNTHLFHYDVHACTFLRYRRPRLRYFEMYALDATLSTMLGFADVQTKPGPAVGANICLYDFTRPPNASPLLFDQRVIDQLNLGQAIASFLEGRENNIKGSMNHIGYSTQLSHELANCHIPVTGGITKVSAFALQVNTRLFQVRYLYDHFPPPSYNRGLLSLTAISNYVGFYNYIWLILNDIIIGCACGIFICDNVASLSYTLRQCIQAALIEDVQETLLWLNNWPAGLKLNTELSALYCHSLSSVLIAWNYILVQFFLPHVDKLLYFVGAIGCCGVTMTTAISSDIVSLLTAHVYVCYSVSLLVFGRQLDIAGALWELFRGKRRNVLRKRTDSWVFDVDQLLFGTILFTLLAFLSPTTATYYAFFALIRLCTLLAYGVFDVILQLINRFPLFALMLLMKDPFRLPEGIFLEVDGDSRSYRLQNQSIPFSRIIDLYASNLSAVLTRRHPIILLKCIITAKNLE